MVSSITIENFKCFKNITVDDMSRVTLFSGMNNIGKSTLLEAIFFLMDHANGTSFMKISSFRDSGTILSAPQDVWEPCFHNNDLSERIRISAQIDGDNNELTLSKADIIIPNLGEGFSDSQKTSVLSAISSPYGIRMQFTRGSYQEDASYYNLKSTVGISSQFVGSLVCKEDGTVTPVKGMPPTRYISSSTLSNKSDAIDLYGTIELNNDRNKLVDALRIIDKDIDDITLVPVNGINRIFLKKNGSSVALKDSGEGINKLLIIIESILAMPGGIVLIDEIENGFYYGLQNNIWKTIIETSKISNTQVIVTTHSYECISAASDAIKELGADNDFCYKRIIEVDNERKLVNYTQEMLSDAVEANIEVR